MPINRQHYATRGGNLAIVLCCPTIVSPDRLVYFDHNPVGNWVIRDFLAGLRLDNNSSSLSVSEIEEDAVYSEPPPWCNVETSRQDWKLYLELRTTVYTAQRNRNVNIQRPCRETDRWHSL
jgi:hypothetical protein